MVNSETIIKHSFCEKCGAKLDDNAVFCEKCGAKINKDVIEGTTVLPKKIIEAKNDASLSSVGIDKTILLPKQNGKLFNNEKTIVLPKKNANSIDSIPSTIDIYSKSSQEYANEYKYAYDKPKKTVAEKKKQKKIIVAVLVVALCLSMATTGLLVWLNMPKKLDFNNYLDDYSLNLDTVKDSGDFGNGFYYSGYDGYATVDIDAENVIDYEKLYKDIYENNIKKKNNKNLDSNMRILLYADNYIDALEQSGITDHITCQLSKTNNLKNGDTVTVNVEIDQDALESMGVYFTAGHYSISYQINDLKKGKVISPFDYVKVVAGGANGNGYAYCKVDRNLNKEVYSLNVKWYDDTTISFVKDGNILSKISFTVEDYEPLSNGDEITVSCETNDFYEKVTNKYDIFTTKTSKEYSISGLGEYATHSSKITSSDLAKFKDDAKSIITNQYSDLKELKYESVHIGDKTNKSELTSDINKVVLIYSFYDDYYEETRFIYVSYDDVILDTKGNVYDSVNNYYSDYSLEYESQEDALYGACTNYGESYYDEYVFN